MTVFLQSVDTARHLSKSVKIRKTTYFRHIHVMRKKDKCLKKEILQGTAPSACPRTDRKRASWTISALDGVDNGRTVADG